MHEIRRKILLVASPATAAIRVESEDISGRCGTFGRRWSVKNLVWPQLGLIDRDSQNADRTGNCVYMITGTTLDRRHDHREGILAKTIEEQTAKLPSDTFLWAAGGSIAASLTLKLIGRDKDALFVGQWAPTFLILGL
jgi:hypothetical protein